MNSNACILVNADLPTIAMGLFHIAATLRQSDIPCHIHKFKETPDLFDAINRHQVRFVGFSIHWHSQLIPCMKLAEQVKSEFPDCIIVLGGLTASYFAEDLIKFQYVDFVVVGDGEIPLLQIARNAPSSQIPNIYWKSEEGGVHFNGIHYETSVCQLRDFVYESNNDFDNTRKILKMGKGCFYHCFHCGGRNKAYQGRGIDRPVVFEAEDIAHCIERNYRALEFTHLYLAQDHFRDIQRITRGITALPAELDKKFSINIGAWGLPAVSEVRKLSLKVRGICLELTFDSIDEALLSESRGYSFNEPVLDHIISYLDEMFQIPNLEIVLFFSYPHVQDKNLLFPDYDTLGALFHLEDRFRKQHLEGRLGICYLLLSTDPGSSYGSGYSFKEYWNKLHTTQSGFGSFCFHYQEYMEENEFLSHHLFLQVVMKIFQYATNFIQYMYRIHYQSDIYAFYKNLFQVFDSLFQEEILKETQVIQSYSEGYSHLGYSCVSQETVGDSQLSNFIFRFLTRCLEQKIIHPDYALVRYLLSSEDRISGAAYGSCIDTAQKRAGEKQVKSTTYPIRNALVEICRQTPHVSLIWSGALLCAGSHFSERKYEVLSDFLSCFSLRELNAVCKLEETSFEALYPMTKEFNFHEKEQIEKALSDLIRMNDRYDLEQYLTKLTVGIPPDFKKLLVNYAISERTHKFIPLTEEELFILDHCNGLLQMESISDMFLGKYALDPHHFDAVVNYFYLNGLII